MFSYFQPTIDAFQNSPYLWYITAAIMGSCVGSFINVVVARLPVMLDNEWNQAAAEQLNVSAPASSGVTLSKPPSTCPKCKHSIRARHNIPVLGWLMLRGRCADCQNPISARYPLVEVAAAILVTLAATQYGVSWPAVTAMGFLLTLLAIALIDADTQLIPDSIALPLLWAGLLINVNAVFVPLADAVIGAAAGYGILWLCFKGFKLVTGKDGMGYGDFKLLAAMGAWLGWEALPLLLLIASLSGAIFGIALRISNKLEAQQVMPFGPWLALAGGIFILWGQQIKHWWLG